MITRLWLAKRQPTAEMQSSKIVRKKVELEGAGDVVENLRELRLGDIERRSGT